MKFYLDITLLPNVEANLGFLWQKVYQQIHIALVENSYLSDEIVINPQGEKEPLKRSNIALSIPKYGDKDYPLGDKIRLFFQSKQQLDSFDVEKTLKRLQDYVYISSIKDVPTIVKQYVCFQRKRIDGETRTADKLIKKARHISKKFTVDYEQLLAELKEKPLTEREKLPFIQVESQSSEKLENNDKTQFKLFIEKKLCNKSCKGTFSCYGLSKTATVPWF